MRRPVEFRDRVEVVDPCRLRANKYLPAWHQFISLAQRSKPHIVGFLLIANRCRIERRPAMRAETLQTDVSAIGSLSIFCRFAGQEHERAWTSDNYRSQWSTAHCLAVCAVANGCRFRIGFGLERHVAAVTASINFHDRFPGIPQIGMDDSWFPDRADSLLVSRPVIGRCRLNVSAAFGSVPQGDGIAPPSL
jgi:hypothetical protein